METAKLKKFAQFARRSLIKQISAKLELVLTENSAAQRESKEAIKKIKDAIKSHGVEQVIERVAYTWFNRICALRFMDVNRYNQIGNSRFSVVSPADGQFQPEILAEAKNGHIEEKMANEKIQQQIYALLDGKSPSRDPQGEAYRLLVVGACNYWHRAMPFLFERIDDYTELLMPDDLLSGNSILAYTREAMTPDACQDVEVIGWLYQFYISEKKDEVFEGLKKNRKITPENIPAATQLFTPHWIVRYLVENSLGRLWMLNRPNSKLIEQMEYYIKPEMPESDFLRINKPEELKICDPACGSGHMLTYAFDVLYAIYEEEGYEPSEIPEKILIHNLYGIEIDERAGGLAAFALTMKARARQSRFFRKLVCPNICVIEKIKNGSAEFKDDTEWKIIVDSMVKAGVDRETLINDLHLFVDADNFGSLLQPKLSSEEALRALVALDAYDQSVKTPSFEFHELVSKCKAALQFVDYLSSKYHVVIANPPYMGGRGMNSMLSVWVKENYPSTKSDLFAMFIERGLELVCKYGYSAMVTMQSWMFLSTYEALRDKLLMQTSIESLVHMANMVMGIAFGTVATVWINKGDAVRRGAYCYVEYEDIVVGNKPKDFPPRNERNEKAFHRGEKDWFYHASFADFKKIPGSPIAYWVSPRISEIFQRERYLDQIVPVKVGLQTGSNEKFVREWFEVSDSKTSLCRYGEHNYAKKWFPYNKGGEFRKWYGNNENIVNWENSGEEIQGFTDYKGKLRSRPQNRDYYFKQSITWSFVSSSYFGVRFSDTNAIFDVGGSSAFPSEGFKYFLTGLLCSKLSHEFMKAVNPTLNFQVGNVASLPVIDKNKTDFNDDIVKRIISSHKIDWNSYETSWDFTSLPLLQPDYRQPTLKATYTNLRAQWREMTLEMQRLEEENNRIFIDAYGLQDELTPEVPLNEITLTCNPYYRPYYRYSNNKNAEELETLLLADTMKEFISYAVGCMFGRYALDKPGLILANQGDTIKEYLKQIPDPMFSADDDNVIPILDGDWFTDDISDRFRKFLRITFGEEHYEENLKFIEVALGKEIRKYFLKDFYNDHLRRYKKRPIYWLFSSPKGSFNALIYMHRYRPDTVSVVLNAYLREFRNKLLVRKTHLEAVSISASASPGEKTKSLKEIESLRKMIEELESYERDILYPLATEQIAIDLDDGVKVNYQKFGPALKKIPSLDTKEE